MRNVVPIDSNLGQHVGGRNLWMRLEGFANEDTYDRRRATYMGFQFSRTVIEQAPDHSGYLSMTGSFKCVCGTLEHYQLPSIKEADIRHAINLLGDEEWLRSRTDPVRALRDLGSFSKEHLLADGYSPEAVNDILRKGWYFDLLDVPEKILRSGNVLMLPRSALTALANIGPLPDRIDELSRELMKSFQGRMPTSVTERITAIRTRLIDLYHLKEKSAMRPGDREHLQAILERLVES